MKTILFVFDILLITVFVSACTINITAYCKTRHVRQLLSGVLLFFFCLNSVIIFMSEFLSDMSFFSGAYNVLTYFGGKAVCGIAISALYLYLVTELMGRKPGMFYLLSLVPLACVTVYVGDLNASVKQHWIFYTVRQIYLAGFHIFYLFSIRRSKKDGNREKYLMCRRYLILGIVFAGLIFLEDSLVIFHFQYVINTLGFKIFQEHNVSEDIFFVFLAVIGIIEGFRCLIAQKPEEVSEPKPVFVRKKPDSAEIMKDPFPSEYGLSNRQRDVFYLLIRDKTYQEMGEELGLSVGTVKFHAHGIYDKTDSKNRSELIEKYKSFHDNQEECKKLS